MNNNVDGRVAKWDNIKFVLMCFVVLGHFINYTDFQSNLLRWLWVSIYSFHMPAFLFLSGLLSKRTITEQRLEKVFAYLYLYFTMEIFQFIVFSIVNGTPSSFVFFSDAGAPWYALVLFWCYVATGCLKSLKSNYVFIFAVVLGILAGYSNLGDFLSGMRFFTLFPFFLAGYYIPTEKLLTVVENRCVKVCSIVFLLVVFFLCYMYRDQLFGVADFLKCRTTYNNTGMLSYGGLFRTCYYVIVFAIVICFIAVIPNVKCVISTWGQRTAQVLVLHYLVLYVLMNKFHFLDFLKTLWPAHYSWFVLPFTVGLTIILSLKVWSPFFNWLMNPKKIIVR